MIFPKVIYLDCNCFYDAFEDIDAIYYPEDETMIIPYNVYTNKKLKNIMYLFNCILHEFIHHIFHKLGFHEKIHIWFDRFDLV
jgi:hypothetical protein